MVVSAGNAPAFWVYQTHVLLLYDKTNGGTGGSRILIEGLLYHIAFASWSGLYLLLLEKPRVKSLHIDSIRILARCWHILMNLASTDLARFSTTGCPIALLISQESPILPLNYGSIINNMVQDIIDKLEIYRIGVLGYFYLEHYAKLYFLLYQLCVSLRQE